MCVWGESECISYNFSEQWSESFPWSRNCRFYPKDQWYSEISIGVIITSNLKITKIVNKMKNGIVEKIFLRLCVRLKVQRQLYSWGKLWSKAILGNTHTIPTSTTGTWNVSHQIARVWLEILAFLNLLNDI